MSTADFLKEKETLKKLAGETVLFGLLPEKDLEEFKKLVDNLIECPGSERFVRFFIGLFEEEKREMAPVIDTLREVVAASSSE